LPGGHVVLELIDVGGMGRIYRAEQRALGRTVAVKIIHPHLSGDGVIEERFATEARAASRINHPNSVSIIDLGKFEGRLYLVMEYLHGRDLGLVAHREGPLAVERVVEIACQVLAALEEAHQHGIVHRDLKPENVMVERLRSGGDFVKVLDFGLAKVRAEAQRTALAAEAADAGSRHVTSPGTVCGTPEYMSPEQARGDAVDARADLYSCGVMLYELLTTRLPFRASSTAELVLMHLSSLPPDPRVVAPERALSAALVDVVLKALAKDPADRHASAAEMAAALRATRTLEARRRVSGEGRRCETCGALIPRTHKFCNECGAPSSRRRASLPPLGLAAAGLSVGGPLPLPLPLCARERELGWLRARRERASSGLVTARLVGPAGAGKTRLLEELAREAELGGDVVCHAGPDPWWCGLGYHALSAAVLELAELPDGGDDAGAWSAANAEARAGLGALFGVSPLALREGEPRSDAARRWSETPPEGASPAGGAERMVVAEALRWAIGVAAARATSGRVLLCIDDLHAVDGASRNAFADVALDPPPAPVLLVAAHPPGFDAGWDDGDGIDLGGIPLDEALALCARADDGGPASEDRRALARSAARSGAGAADARRVAPMYVEQLLRLGAEGGGEPPTLLSDLVALRVGRLPAEARRVLQAVSVLGDSARTAQLVALLPDLTDLGRWLERLEQAGLVVRRRGEVGPGHPLVRELTLASTPLAVRRELHVRARRDYGIEELEIPIEAHALHAYHAAASFEALLLLEQVAARARARGDLGGAVDALRRGLELARMEIGRGELDDPLGAAVLFSCKLGDALAEAGKYGDAEGILREAVELVGPAGEARPRVLTSLAAVARAEGDEALARARIEEALALAARAEAHDSELVASLRRMLATLGGRRLGGVA
jgi:serine/threonine-protein kinase